MKATNPTTQAQRRYMREFWIAIAAYGVILAASVYGLNHGVSGLAKYLVSVAPVLPIVAIFIAVVRWLRSIDEYLRVTTITGMAIAGGCTALFAVTYGFLENAGLPRLSAWITYLLFMLIWAIATPIVQRMPR